MTDGNEDEAPRKQKGTAIKLKRNEDGYPILPSVKEISSYGLLSKKKLIGKFIGDVYGS